MANCRRAPTQPHWPPRTPRHPHWQSMCTPAGGLRSQSKPVQVDPSVPEHSSAPAGDRTVSQEQWCPQKPKRNKISASSSGRTRPAARVTQLSPQSGQVAPDRSEKRASEDDGPVGVSWSVSWASASPPLQWEAERSATEGLIHVSDVQFQEHSWSIVGANKMIFCCC